MKTSIHIRRVAVALCAFAGAVVTANATSLTFDIYTNAAKTMTMANGAFVPQTYGDNVTDFDPSGAFGSFYYRYGTNSGYTPSVTAEYRFYKYSDPTNPSNQENGPPNGYFYNTGFGDLTNVIYNSYFNTWMLEVRLIPTNYVKLASFDIAGFGGNFGGQTLKIVQNANSPTARTLWSAGPDFSVLVHGGATHDHYDPNVGVDVGSTLSLIMGYGGSGKVGLDNITFTEVPEPSSLTLLSIGLGALMLRPRRAVR